MVTVSKKNIVLIGFMGVGKTTIGQLVANKVNRAFIDIDQEIEKDLQMTIPEIFKQKGEAFFRKTEKDYIFKMCEQTTGKIISLGGGAFQQEEIRKKCLENCIVLFLDLSWEHWKKRIDLLIETRPILQHRSLAEIKQLYNDRKTIYASHHIKVDTDHQNPEAVVDQIVDKLNL
ncbi:shikimate kinase [Bacillus sp. CLL-7-23]|uniref:Shikimate kinase n=1 Tax=Bacillus changyiensis TaxID=3004103 RepID=A0ABT4X2G1_9BACI|nr:shikimate kinase [Bacillus changyiensis]MDA7026431.1 shikimate kinase [Bacillus changyiensis]